MEANWYDDETGGTARLEQTRSDAIDALRGAPSFSLTVRHRGEGGEHFAGATEQADGDATTFCAYAALKAIQDFAACSNSSFDECLEVLREADQRGL